MEELKFYDVKVGKSTRAGNLNVFQSFVAKSDKNQNDVYRYYLSKYKGFDISVEEIREVVADNIPKSGEKDWLGRDDRDIKIENLENELSKAKQAKEINKFEGKVNWNKISDEITENTKEMFKLAEAYKDKKDALENKIRRTIRETYNEFIDSVSLNDWKPDGSQVKFTAYLKGKLFSEYSEQ